jgi:hypothetical protein
MASRLVSEPGPQTPVDRPPMHVIADTDEGWAERTSLFGDLEG